MPIQRIDRLRETVLSIRRKLLAAKGEAAPSPGKQLATERQTELATGGEARGSEGEMAALLAQLETALIRGEAAAHRLKSERKRHLLLERESRAAVAVLDRLIASNG